MAVARAVVLARRVVRARRRDAALRRLRAARPGHRDPLAPVGQGVVRERGLVPAGPQVVLVRVAGPARDDSAVDDRDDTSQAAFE